MVGVALIAAARPASQRPDAAFALAAVPAVVTVGWLLTALPDVVDGALRTEHVEWIPHLGVALDLRLDGLAAVMLLLVAGIGVLVMAYAWRYFDQPEPTDMRLVGLLVLFAGSMVGLVLADDLLVLYGFWELTSITSFLLIGNKHTDPTARAAALQALLVTGLGALAMLTGFIVLGQAAGTYRLSEIIAVPPSGTAVTVAVVLILLGAFTKSAQVPFHAWLPGAMAAPTPVSAYLHSATMVKAGVYLIARLAPAFLVLDLWRPLVETVGVATMILGGLRALRQYDLKLLLAYGTISQLGFMVAVFGWGTEAALVAGCVMLLAHGAFKAAAFMVVGIVDHQHGTRDVRRLPRPTKGWQPTMAVAAVAAGSMAGVPMLFGFVAKEADFATFVDQGTGATATLAGIAVGSVLTVAYSLRFLAGITGRLADPNLEPAATASESHGAPSLAFVVPGIVLTAATLLLGVLPGLVDDLITAAASASEGVHLAVWHGVNLELVLSGIALVVGTLLYRARRRVAAVLAYGRFVPPSSGAYLGALRGMNTVANRLTAVAQPGSLPIYLGVILLTAALVPGALLMSGAWWPGWPDAVEVPAHIPIAALLIGLALAAAIVRRRFAGAVFLGMVGYSMAALFVAQGAPDLALTQIAIETLSTVLFVLVLRRLPDRFETSRGAARRTVRIAIATIFGGLVFLFTLSVGSIDADTDVSDTMIEQAYPEGDGRNVVNVILVDIRGFDTLGEMTVLTAVAIGTVALARAGRRPHDIEAREARQQRETEPERRTPAARARLISIEVSVRIVFAAVMTGSLWLLFAGHNQPGGGFVGGIVAGAAVSLRYVSGGLREVRQLSRGKPWMVLGSGLLTSVTMAIAPLLLGGEVLQSGAHTFDLPLLGAMKVTSAVFFDIGVYLAVIGLALMVFESFGDEPVLPLGDPAAPRERLEEAT